MTNPEPGHEDNVANPGHEVVKGHLNFRKFQIGHLVGPALIGNAGIIHSVTNKLCVRERRLRSFSEVENTTQLNLSEIPMTLLGKGTFLSDHVKEK